MCREQTAVSHNTIKSVALSFDAALRWDGVVLEITDGPQQQRIFQNQSPSSQNTFFVYYTPRSPSTHREPPITKGATPRSGVRRSGGIQEYVKCPQSVSGEGQRQNYWQEARGERNTEGATAKEQVVRQQAEEHSQRQARREESQQQAKQTKGLSETRRRTTRSALQRKRCSQS